MGEGRRPWPLHIVRRGAETERPGGLHRRQEHAMDVKLAREDRASTTTTVISQPDTGEQAARDRRDPR